MTEGMTKETLAVNETEIENAQTYIRKESFAKLEFCVGEQKKEQQGALRQEFYTFLNLA